MGGMFEYLWKGIILSLVVAALMGGGCGACGLYLYQHIDVAVHVQRK